MTRHRRPSDVPGMFAPLAAMAVLFGMPRPTPAEAQVQLYPDTLHLRAEQNVTPEVFEIHWLNSALGRFKVLVVQFPTGFDVQGYGAASDRASALPCGVGGERQRMDVVGQRLTYDLTEVPAHHPTPCALGGVVAFLPQDVGSFLEIQAFGVLPTGDTVRLEDSDPAWPRVGLTVIRPAQAPYQRALVFAALAAGALLLVTMFGRSTGMGRRQGPRAT